MANHLTPTELARESGLERRYVISKCLELGVPIFACAGVPGPRFPMWPQEVRLIDRVMYDFPELVFVTRHGCEPLGDGSVSDRSHRVPRPMGPAEFRAG